MPRYLNTSGATLTFQGVTFKPGDIHDVPSAIHSRVMYPINLPCTKIIAEVGASSTSNAVSLPQNTVQSKILSDESNKVIKSDNKNSGTSKQKTKTIKEEKDGTNNDK